MENFSYQVKLLESIVKLKRQYIRVEGYKVKRIFVQRNISKYAFLLEYLLEYQCPPGNYKGRMLKLLARSLRVGFYLSYEMLAALQCFKVTFIKLKGH